MFGRKEKGVVNIIKLEIDIFNRKSKQKLEAENLILKQQIANYRNEIFEWNRRFVNESTRVAAANKK